MFLYNNNIDNNDPKGLFHGILINLVFYKNRFIALNNKDFVF